MSRPRSCRRVGAELVDEPDAATLVAPHVDDDAAVLLDRVERGLELRAALALERAEGLARQALGVHAHERRVVSSSPDTTARWSVPVTRSL